MDSTEVITLLDSIWFNLEIFKKRPPTTKPITNPHYPKNQENPQEPESIIHKRSKSDQSIPTMASSYSSMSLSPISVLPPPAPPHLQTILSGKESTDGGIQEQSRIMMRRRARAKRGVLTKSLSDLEFEELKGLNDLGFVFSEDELSPYLVDIVPGLQRLGKKGVEKTEHCSGGHRRSCSSCYESLVQRPYLSEAWEVEDERINNNPLTGWKVNSSSEIDMKDSLKWWAQTVASTVK